MLTALAVAAGVAVYIAGVLKFASEDRPGFTETRRNPLSRGYNI